MVSDNGIRARLLLVSISPAILRSDRPEINDLDGDPHFRDPDPVRFVLPWRDPSTPSDENHLDLLLLPANPQPSSFSLPIPLKSETLTLGKKSNSNVSHEAAATSSPCQSLKALIDDASSFIDDLVLLIPAKLYLPVLDADKRPWFQGFSKTAMASPKKQFLENLKKVRRQLFTYIDCHDEHDFISNSSVSFAIGNVQPFLADTPGNWSLVLLQCAHYFSRLLIVCQNFPSSTFAASPSTSIATSPTPRSGSSLPPPVEKQALQESIHKILNREYKYDLSFSFESFSMAEPASSDNVSPPLPARRNSPTTGSVFFSRRCNVKSKLYSFNNGLMHYMHHIISLVACLPNTCRYTVVLICLRKYCRFSIFGVLMLR